VFDYNSSTCADDIKLYTKGCLRYVLDIITDGTSQTICHQALGRAGGFYTALELPSEDFNVRKRTVKLEMVVGLCALGKQVALKDGYERPANPIWREHAGDFFTKMQKFVDSGKIRPHPTRVLENGFKGFIEGTETLRHRRTSGEKLIVIL
jgi:NADPH:quinone reductase-like Zn-dependent oxidoreductase